MKILFALSILFTSAWVNASVESDPERLQAIYIQKIINHVAWPSINQTDFTIAIYDNEKLFSALSHALSNQRFNGKKVKIIKADKNLNIRTVQIVCAHVSKKFKHLPTEGVLYITDDHSGLKGNSILNFFLEEGKLRFDIDQSKANESHLRINSRLLKMARSLK